MLSWIKDNYTFRIDREITQGGMGTVYEATQMGPEGFEKKVAVKTLRQSLSKNQRFTGMFLDEAKLVANLVHENIVQLYQMGHCKEGYYIVMEYVHGMSLLDFVHLHAVTNEVPPTELAVFIASRIARGLAYAHSRQDQAGNPLNIVHRDVSPGNIMITTEGLPKLLDFGIAKAAGQVVGERDETLMGKVYYMSPEQAQRLDLDYRADIFALGLVLFELLALRKARSRWKDDIIAAAKDGRVDWEALPTGLDPSLVTILRRMLARDLDERYDNTGHVGYDLEYFIYHKGYGPTVVTLENYLRERVPYLYSLPVIPHKDDHTVLVPKTVLMPGE